MSGRSTAACMPSGRGVTTSTRHRSREKTRNVPLTMPNGSSRAWGGSATRTSAPFPSSLARSQIGNSFARHGRDALVELFRLPARKFSTTADTRRGRPSLVWGLHRRHGVNPGGTRSGEVTDGYGSFKVRSRSWTRSKPRSSVATPRAWPRPTSSIRKDAGTSTRPRYAPSLANTSQRWIGSPGRR